MPQPETPPQSEAKMFANRVENAFLRFKLLRSLVQGQTAIVSQDLILNMRGVSDVIASLCQLIIMECIRMHRMLEHGKMHHLVPDERRKPLMHQLKDADQVRNVNEHGTDLHRKGSAPIIRPQMHQHEELSAVLDETSLIILGPETVLMGPLNVMSLGPTLAELQSHAGYQALASRETTSTHM